MNRTPTIHRLLNVALALAMCFGLAYVWPDAEAAHSASQAAAVAKQGEAFRLDRAAKAICGDGAAWDLIAEKTIQCFTHQGRKTITAEVTP